MKVPKMFKPDIKERRFKRKVLSRVYIESERDFLLGLYSLGPEGRYTRPEEVSEEEGKRLKVLARSIKKNKGVVRTGKISLIAILVAGIVVFNFAFKNRLLERGLERTLEAVFSAKAEVDGLDFRILDGRLSFQHLSVADEDQPMRNLFELGATEVDLNTGQLLKGKVVISNLDSRQISWHTPRDSSGALPAEQEAAKPTGQATAGRGGLSLNLGSLDVEALIDQQLAKLSSPGLIEQLNGRIRSLQTDWQERVEQGRSDVEQLSGRIDAVRSIDVQTLDTAAELQQAVADIQEAAAAVNRAGEDLRQADDQIKADRRDIASARQEFQAAVDADVAYLSSLSDLSSGELKNLVSDLAGGYLEQSLGRTYGYVQKARGYAQRLIDRRREKRGNRKQDNRMGRGVDVAFPAVNYPRFLLQDAGVSLQDASTLLQGSLHNLSSNPDLVDKPVSFTFLRSQAERRLSVDGMVDVRQNRDTDLELGVQAAGFTFSVSEGLEDLGLSSVEAQYRLQTELSRSRLGKATEGRGLLELYDLIIQPVSEQNRLGTVLHETLGSLSQVDVAFDYSVQEGQPLRVKARSSADAQVARALEKIFAEISAQYADRLRDQLTARMADQIRENEALSEAFAGLVGRSEGNLADAAAYEAALAEKRGEVQRRIADTQKQATEAVRSQLESQLERLPLPKLGF